MGRHCRAPLPAFAEQRLWSGKRFSGQAAVSRQQGNCILAAKRSDPHKIKGILSALFLVSARHLPQVEAGGILEYPETEFGDDSQQMVKDVCLD